MLRIVIYLFGITGLLFAQDTNNKLQNPDPKRFREEIEYFKWYDSKNSFPVDAVLFVGSSSIRFWPTVKYFPKSTVINRGFGGAHISDVLYFLDSLVIKYNPKVIVFYAGDNDVAAGKGSDQVFDDYVEFVESVKRDLPKTKIIYIPIKPSLDRWSFWKEMEKANDEIRLLCEKDKSLFYTDIATSMIGNDSLPDSTLFIEDGLHLNSRGYELWTRVLLPVLQMAINATK